MAVEPKTCAKCGRVFKTEQDFLKNTNRWRVCEMQNLWFNCTCHSTLMIPKGKYDWYRPEAHMSDEAAGLFNKFGALKSLPHIPTAIMELQQKLQSQDFGAPELARALRKDPTLAAEVLATGQRLKEARNPDDRPMSSLEHAIVYLGLGTVRDIIQLAAIKSFVLNCKFFDVKKFWDECFLIGVIAEKLMPMFQVTESKDEVYLAGTLCNVGKVVAAISFPDQLDAVHRDSTQPKRVASWPIMETANDSIEHTLLGEIGAAFWGFPEFVLDCARFHHSWPLKDSTALSNASLVQVVSFSNQLMHWILFQPERIDKPMLEGFMRKLNLSERDIEEICEQQLMPLKNVS